MFLPLASLTSDASLSNRLGEHTIFVQGSIDLLLRRPDGELWLFDYKTDRIRDDESNDLSRLTRRMTAEHSDQLAYYAKAIERLFGKSPEKRFIYSLPLGAAIEIEDSQRN